MIGTLTTFSSDIEANATKLYDFLWKPYLDRHVNFSYRRFLLFLFLVSVCLYLFLLF